MDFLLAFMLIVSLVAICAIGVFVGLYPAIRDTAALIQGKPARRPKRPVADADADE